MTRCTILVPPSPPAAPHSVEVSLRRFHDLDRFADALGSATGTAVPIVEGDLADAPAEGFLLVLDGTDAESLRGLRDPTLCARIVPMLVTLGVAYRCVVDSGMPAAVAYQGYLDWQDATSTDGGSGLVGHGSVARGAGLRIGPDVGVAAEILGPRDLPTLLAVYLDRWR